MNIALVAHDSRKKELIEWVKYNWMELSSPSHKLYATGTTCKLIRQALAEAEVSLSDEDDITTDDYFDSVKHVYDEKVNCLLSGPLGGDQQIGAMIAEGKIDVLIFFCDNLVVQGHQTDVSALTRLASLYNIAFATNRTTADMILTSSLFNNNEYQRIVPKKIENYANRQI